MLRLFTLRSRQRQGARRFVPTSFIALISLCAALASACDDDDLSKIEPEPDAGTDAGIVDAGEPPTGSVVGKVCDPAGINGVGGADVYVLLGFSAEGVERVSTTTAADGTFELDGVPPGTYTLFVQAGSFENQVADVEVRIDEVTDLSEIGCISPEDIKLTVYDGHDSVEEVLERLGYSGFTIVDTRHEWDEHQDDPSSWIAQEFSDLETMQQNDILFINCGPHEWALDNAEASQLSVALANLRTFVEEGGSLYLSDWSYDLLELLYPDAVDWWGDDTERNAAEVGVAQEFLADVLDVNMQYALGFDKAVLRYDFSRIAMPVNLGPTARALLAADIEAEIADDVIDTFEDVPVLLEVVPETDDPETVGRVIFTTFHNGHNNTADMDWVLQAIVYSL